MQIIFKFARAAFIDCGLSRLDYHPHNLRWVGEPHLLFAEDHRINFGKLTPWIIAGMIGSCPHKVSDEDDGKA